MINRLVVGALSELSHNSCGVFRGRDAVAAGVTRKQISVLVANGGAERLHADVYRMTVVASSSEQLLRAAVLWGGAATVVTGRSAGELYTLRCIQPGKPEIIVPLKSSLHCESVIVHRSDDRAAMMIRRIGGLQVTGVEATFVSLARSLDEETLEIACEDASPSAAYVGPGPARLSRTVWSMPARVCRRAAIARSARPGERGPFHTGGQDAPPARRERTHRASSAVARRDFCFERAHTILETNGWRWHGDPVDYEGDNEKWSVPGRHGYKIVFATWAKVTERPAELVCELRAALVA